MSYIAVRAKRARVKLAWGRDGTVLRADLVLVGVDHLPDVDADAGPAYNELSDRTSACTPRAMSSDGTSEVTCRRHH